MTWTETAARMLHGAGSSTMQWRHIDRVEVAATGVVTTTPVVPDQAFQGVVVEPVRLRLFTDATLARTSTAIVLHPQDFTDWTPSVLDQVQVEADRWLTVVDIKSLTAPGGTGLPVPVALVVALGSP